MFDKLKNWKLKLRYGKLKTPFLHFTVMLDGIVTDKIDKKFSCPQGLAWMGIKVWAKDVDEAGDVAHAIALDLGFQPNRVMVYSTEPKQPPRGIPSGYDAQFTPYSEEKK